ncbi:MAG: D-alanyl-D-alanine carboxypeptidase/D-alanyl-D-alanine endopeptidase [Planktomarina sp.]
MTSNLSRRLFLGSTLAGFAAPALGFAPPTSLRPLAREDVILNAPPQLDGAGIVKQAGLNGRVAFAIADVDSPELLDVGHGDQMMAPASVTKAMTAAYALDQLGPDHHFPTWLRGTGSVVDGVLQGDLILQGSGDPTLNTDRLGTLVEELRRQGIWRVAGRFILDPGATPLLRQIDPLQPPQVAYNPSVAGLNLNFNRIRFDWTRNNGVYDMTMRASGKRYDADVMVSRIIPTDTNGPIYRHEMVDGGEAWMVSRDALGREGGRWLPTRIPLLHTGEAFRSIARTLQINVPAPEVGSSPQDAVEIARTISEPLTDIARDMLKFSNNMTAEALGFAASGGNSLSASALMLSNWTHSQGMKSDFVDHSGLGEKSQVSAAGLVRFMMTQSPDSLQPILKDMTLNNNGQHRAPGMKIYAKTGSLNFVSALSGYLVKDDKRYAFGILTDNLSERAKIKPEDREHPAGGGYWAKRSRSLQYKLLRHWASGFA